MPRPKKRTTEPKQSSTNPFVEALSFLANITKDVGAPFETHVYLRNGFATASNGVLSAGIKITEDIFACPKNSLMIQALSKCGQNLSITQLDNDRISVKSDKFKAFVPCIDPAILTFSFPDEPVGIINDNFRTALQALEVIKSTGEKIYDNSILMNGYSTIATTGSVLFEYWHGIDLPNGISIPKDFIKPLSNINKKLIKFGFSISTFTVWFEDDSWIKTQLYANRWPDISHILEGTSNPFPVPADFFEGLNAIAPFSEEGTAYFYKEKLSSHNTEGVGASFDVAGLPSGPIYPIKQLQLLKGLADTIDFVAPLNDGNYCLRFFGKAVRGLITGRSK